MNVQELAFLIALKQFAFNAVDNLTVDLSKEEVKLLRAKIPLLDKKIVQGIINLNLSTLTTNENTK